MTENRAEASPVGESLRARVKALSFSYGRQLVLRGVTFDLGAGVCGLLGPNGAGKSTLMNLVSTLLPLTDGEIEVAGLDIRERSGRRAARSAIGYLPQHFDTVGSMTATAHVEYAAWAHGVAEGDCSTYAASALESVDLTALARRRARTLSGGERQRLGIACAVVHQPQILLLDEPTVGLDPVQRMQFRKYLRVIGENAAVLLSTHLVDDLSQMADRALVLVEGRLGFDGSLAALSSRSPAEEYTSPLESGYRDVVQSIAQTS